MWELKVVRERRAGYGRPVGSSMTTSAKVCEAFKDRAAAADREEFIVVLLDGKNKMIGFNVVSVGTLTASLCHPREIFKAAIIGNAAGIILLHNHPSGDPAPSAEDKAITLRLTQAGTLLGIQVLDHVIIGDGTYYSFCDAGTMP